MRAGIIITALAILFWSFSAIAAPDCSDGLDNDGDGLIDYTNDPGCKSQEDETERCGWRNPSCPFCDNNRDDDGDGYIDYPDDMSCASALQDSEVSVCSDGADNDGDGAIDWPSDIGCANGADSTETAPYLACDDGEDNDGDGDADYPDDPGCWGPEDNWEGDLTLPCDDGKNNETRYPWDNLIDLDDPDCQYRRQLTYSEYPQCFDGWDNDGDGLIDAGGDPGCWGRKSRYREDPACNDGEDNDGDGLTDLDDPHCTFPMWESESIYYRAPGFLGGVGSCGLGVELLPLIPIFWVLRAGLRK